MNRRRPKPDDAALTVAIAHLERDAHIASNNADVALREKRLGDAAHLEQNRDRLMWVVDMLVWRRLTDAGVTARMEAKADAEALGDAVVVDGLAEWNRQFAESSTDAKAMRGIDA